MNKAGDELSPELIKGWTQVAAGNQNMTASVHTIRIANATDAAAVSCLLEVSYTALLPAFYTDTVMAQILPLITKANPLLLNSGMFYVATAGRGNVVGCGGWSIRAPKIGVRMNSQGNIRHFATHPDWLRRGIGRDILHRCVKEARAQKIERLNCYSALGAEPFYGANGFLAIKQIDVPLTDEFSFPATLMYHELS